MAFSDVGESDEVTDTATSEVVAERTISQFNQAVIKSFNGTTNGSSQGGYLWGLEGNGKLLVDSGVSVANVPTIASTYVPTQVLGSRLLLIRVQQTALQ